MSFSNFQSVCSHLKNYLEYERDMGIEGYILKERKPMENAPAMQKEDLTIEKIREKLGDCRRCKLHTTRTNIVFGSGNPDADLMFIGEAPGKDEDIQGLPFVGKAGNLLTKIIESIGLNNLEPIGLKREDVYIANILKSRPPDNRNPEPDEISACFPFLLDQIKAVKPKIICSLGTFSAQTLLEVNTPIGKLRGQFYPFQGALLLPTFHPAYLLRSPRKKADVWEDMKMIAKEYLKL